jgi:hypothetical protein
VAVLVAHRDVRLSRRPVLLRPSPLSPSPEILLSLSPPVLRALVATFGGLEGIAANGTPHAIARAVFEGRARAKLAKVLASVVGRFSSDVGRRAIVEAARAKRDARAEGWLDLPAGDVAALLAIESRSKRGDEAEKRRDQAEKRRDQAEKRRDQAEKCRDQAEKCGDEAEKRGDEAEKRGDEAEKRRHEPEKRRYEPEKRRCEPEKRRYEPEKRRHEPEKRNATLTPRSLVSEGTPGEHPLTVCPPPGLPRFRLRTGLIWVARGRVRARADRDEARADREECGRVRSAGAREPPRRKAGRDPRLREVGARRGPELRRLPRLGGRGDARQGAGKGSAGGGDARAGTLPRRRAAALACAARRASEDTERSARQPQGVEQVSPVRVPALWAEERAVPTYTSSSPPARAFPAEALPAGPDEALVKAF